MIKMDNKDLNWKGLLFFLFIKQNQSFKKWFSQKYYGFHKNIKQHNLFNTGNDKKYLVSLKSAY